MNKIVIEETNNQVLVEESTAVVVNVVTEGPQGAQGPAGPAIESLGQIADVDTTGVVDGSLLVYNASTAKYVAGPLDTRLTVTNGGNF